MPKKQTKTTAVKDRLTEKLNSTDWASITECLLNHMVANNLQAADLSSFDNLLVDLLPMLPKVNKYWEGIASRDSSRAQKSREGSATTSGT